MSNYFIRIERLKGRFGLILALKHNKRELVKQSLSIDQIKSQLNYSLVNDFSATEINNLASQMMKDSGIKERKNRVVGIEVLFSLPVGNTKIDSKLFFLDCLSWLKEEFDIPILSFDIHLDESAKHAHAILLPLRNKKMCGSEIIGFVGKLNKRLDSFFQQIGVKYGLKKAVKSKYSQQDKSILYKKIISTLKGDPAEKSIIWECC